MEKIVGLVRPLAKAAGKLETRDAILQHYVQLVRENLHVCLCMSPIGAGFRNRCRMFPSLVNCCTVDWFNVRHGRGDQVCRGTLMPLNLHGRSHQPG